MSRVIEFGIFSEQKSSGTDFAYSSTTFFEVRQTSQVGKATRTIGLFQQC
jgi:hypothetical protein